MKKRELNGWRSKNAAEIKKAVLEKNDKLRKLRFDLAAQKTKNHRQIRTLRKDIARLETVARELPAPEAQK